MNCGRNAAWPPAMSYHLIEMTHPRSLPPVVFHPAYSAPMPPGHRFPMHKYARLAQVLEEESLIGPEGFYIAGVDPHQSDRLGRLGLSDEGLAARDAYVLETCLAVAPVVGVIGGGYDDDIDRLARRHTILYRAAADIWRNGLARPAA